MLAERAKLTTSEISLNITLRHLTWYVCVDQSSECNENVCIIYIVVLLST